MTGMSRREFVEKAAVGSAAAGFLTLNAAELGANPLGMPIGAQIYPLSPLLKDFPAFVKMMAGHRRDEARAVFADRIRRLTSPSSRTGKK